MAENFLTRVRRKMAIAETNEKARQLLEQQAKIDAQAKKLAAEKVVQEGMAIVTSPTGETEIVQRAPAAAPPPGVFRDEDVPRVTTVKVEPAAMPKPPGLAPRTKPVVKPKKKPAPRPVVTPRATPAPMAAAQAAAPGTVPAIIQKRGLKVKQTLFPMLMQRLGGGKNAWIIEHILVTFVQGDMPAFEKALATAGFDRPEIDMIEKELGEKTNQTSEGLDVPLPNGAIVMQREVEKPLPINHIIYGGERNYTEEARQRRRNNALKKRQEIAMHDPSRIPEPVTDIRTLLDDEEPMSMF